MTPAYLLVPQVTWLDPTLPRENSEKIESEDS